MALVDDLVDCLIQTTFGIAPLGMAYEHHHHGAASCIQLCIRIDLLAILVKEAAAEIRDGRKNRLIDIGFHNSAAIKMGEINQRIRQKVASLQGKKCLMLDSDHTLPV